MSRSNSTVFQSYGKNLWDPVMYSILENDRRNDSQQTNGQESTAYKTVVSPYKTWFADIMKS